MRKSRWCCRTRQRQASRTRLERATSGPGSSGSNGSDKANGKAAKSKPKDKEVKSKKGSDGDAQADINVRHNSILYVEKAQDTNDKEREQYLDNTRKYLKECMDQINYLLTPPPQQPQQPMLPNGNYTGLPDAPLSVEDIYVRNQQRNRMPPGQGLQQQSQIPNHMPPPIPNSLPQSGVQLVRDSYDVPEGLCLENSV